MRTNAWIVMVGAAAVAWRSAGEPAPDMARMHDELSPHGAWLDVAEYGRVWRPHVGAHDEAWRPYCHDGRWQWTQHGWHWASDYAWGWLTFHYGRWVQLCGYGWIWVPGFVWAPAWVEWRCGDSHVGWAPLAPAPCGGVNLTVGYHGDGFAIELNIPLDCDPYVFVPCGAFLDANLAGTVLAPSHARDLYRRTTVVRRHDGTAGPPNDWHHGPGRRTVECRDVVERVRPHGPTGTPHWSPPPTQPPQNTRRHETIRDILLDRPRIQENRPVRAVPVKPMAPTTAPATFSTSLQPGTAAGTTEERIQSMKDRMRARWPGR